MRKKLIMALLFFTGLSFSVLCQSVEWRFEVNGGAPVNIPLPISIYQDNEPDIRFTARYKSKAFTSPFYWVWRIGRWSNNKALEIESVHHKLYLINRPEEIHHFHISHGYNLLTINRAFEINLLEKHKAIVRAGAGIVLAHPENEVRGKRLDEKTGFAGLGYYISGPALNLSLAKRIDLGDHLYINIESKLNPSVANIPIADGHANVWNIHCALAFGIGWRK